MRLTLPRRGSIWSLNPLGANKTTPPTCNPQALLPASSRFHAPEVFWGIAYGPYHADQAPGSERSLTSEQIRADMPHLAALSKRIRTYSVEGVQGDIPTIAAPFGMSVWLGAWIGKGKAANDREVDRLINLANKPSLGIEAVIVGNEVRYRNDLSISDLTSYLRRVRKALPSSIPIAYADAGDILLKQAPSFKDEVDIIIANIHPYWGMIPVREAVQNVFKIYQDLLSTYSGKRVVIGETGWPSKGMNRGDASPSETAEAIFIRDLIQLSHEHPEIEFFYFSAFDEPYKRGGDTMVEPYWGVYYSDGRTKLGLNGIIPTRSTIPDRVVSIARAAKNKNLLLRNGKLAAGLELGVDTDLQQRQWVYDRGDALELAYPPGQKWGAVYMAVGKIVPDSGRRETRDYSQFTHITLDLRGLTPGATVAIGIKTPRDPDNGNEPTYILRNIPDRWQVYKVPLAALISQAYPLSRLKSAYIPLEFVFKGPKTQRVLVRHARFTSDAGKQVPSSSLPVYVGTTLSPGFDMGVDTSGGLQTWVVNHHGYMECRYPRGQQWGAIFITAGRITPDASARKKLDLSSYRYLVLELRGKEGGEGISIGLKTVDDPDNGLEPKVRAANLKPVWTTFRIPLSRYSDTVQTWSERKRRIYVVCEIVFEPDDPPQTIEFRNIRFEK